MELLCLAIGAIGLLLALLLAHANQRATDAERRAEASEARASVAMDKVRKIQAEQAAKTIDMPEPKHNLSRQWLGGYDATDPE